MDLGTQTLGWGFGGATVESLSGFELCVICQGSVTATATPTEGILGPASADGLYDNANGSIAGNPAHNPFVNGTATFVIDGIPAGATIDNAIFSFSTAAGVNVDGTPGGPPPPTVPEPASMLLTGTVLLVLARLGTRLRSRKLDV